MNKQSAILNQVCEITHSGDTITYQTTFHIGNAQSLPIARKNLQENAPRDKEGNVSHLDILYNTGVVEYSQHMTLDPLSGATVTLAIEYFEDLICLEDIQAFIRAKAYIFLCKERYNILEFLQESGNL